MFWWICVWFGILIEVVLIGFDFICRGYEIYVDIGVCLVIGECDDGKIGVR